MTRFVTSGGIHGVIVNVKEATVMLKVDDNVKIEVQKASIGVVRRKVLINEQESAMEAGRILALAAVCIWAYGAIHCQSKDGRILQKGRINLGLDLQEDACRPFAWIRPRSRSKPEKTLLTGPWRSSGTG